MAKDRRAITRKAKGREGQGHEGQGHEGQSHEGQGIELQLSQGTPFLGICDTLLATTESRTDIFNVHMVIVGEYCNI